MHERLDNFTPNHPLVVLGFETKQAPISQSCMTDYYACQRYAMFRYRLGLVPKGIGAKSLIAGDFTHAAMRMLSLGYTFDETKAVVLRTADESIKKATDELGVIAPGAIETVKELADLSLAMASGFQAVLAEKGFGLFDRNRTEILHTEKSVRLALPKGVTHPKVRGQQDIILVGTVDALIHNLDKDRYEINDYKTTSKSPTLRAKVASFDPQVAIYRILGGELEPLHEPTRFNHWVLKKPTIRRKMIKDPLTGLKRRETLEEFCVRVKEWYDEKAAEKPDDPPIVFSWVSLGGPKYKKPFVRQLREVHGAMTNRRVDADLWPQTGAPGKCGDWYGKPCQYIGLCGSDPVVWTDTIMNYFRQDFRYGTNENCEADDAGD